jgi:hypothetical protein
MLTLHHYLTGGLAYWTHAHGWATKVDLGYASKARCSQAARVSLLLCLVPRLVRVAPATRFMRFESLRHQGAGNRKELASSGRGEQEEACVIKVGKRQQQTIVEGVMHLGLGLSLSLSLPPASLSAPI